MKRTVKRIGRINDCAVIVCACVFEEAGDTSRLATQTVNALRQEGPRLKHRPQSLRVLCRATAVCSKVQTSFVETGQKAQISDSILVHGGTPACDMSCSGLLMSSRKSTSLMQLLSIDKPTLFENRGGKGLRSQHCCSCNRLLETHN